MMRYLLLIRGDESAAAHADDGCGGWTERMLERGVLQGGGGLRPPADGVGRAVRRDQGAGGRVLPDRGGGPGRGGRGGRRASGGDLRDHRGPRAVAAAVTADVKATVDAVFREEWGRVVATLIRVTGDWDLAEECAQDAFALALQRWPA